MPATLRPSSSTSFGHLISASAPDDARRPRPRPPAAAAAAARGSRPSRAAPPGRRAPASGPGGRGRRDCSAARHERPVRARRAPRARARGRWSSRSAGGGPAGGRAPRLTRACRRRIRSSSSTASVEPRRRVALVDRERQPPVGVLVEQQLAGAGVRERPGEASDVRAPPEALAETSSTRPDARAGKAPRRRAGRCRSGRRRGRARRAPRRRSRAPRQLERHQRARIDRLAGVAERGPAGQPRGDRREDVAPVERRRHGSSANGEAAMSTASTTPPAPRPPARAARCRVRRASARPPAATRPRAASPPTPGSTTARCTPDRQ